MIDGGKGIGSRIARKEERCILVGQRKEDDSQWALTGELGMLRMAGTMDKRCHILRKLGAVFYEDPDTYVGFHYGLGPVEHSDSEIDYEDDSDTDENNVDKDNISHDMEKVTKRVSRRSGNTQ
jgi:hypothetical protein